MQLVRPVFTPPAPRLQQQGLRLPQNKLRNSKSCSKKISKIIKNNGQTNANKPKFTNGKQEEMFGDKKQSKGSEISFMSFSIVLLPSATAAVRL